MLYFLHGEDSVSAIAKAHELIAILQKKKPDAAFFTLTEETVSAGQLQEFAQGQGLFEQKYIVLLDRVLVSKETKEMILERLESFAASEHIFILLEGKLDKATSGKIEKKAEKTQVFENGPALERGGADEPVRIPDFNIFALSDALGRRDKKELWVLYQKALLKNASPEEISGTLFWQVKSMLVARQSASAGQSGLNPYVFQKSKSFEKNYPEALLPALSEKLISIYHDAHRGKHDFAIALERLILSL